MVGDVHDRWDHEDELALRHLGVDLVLLVGDFGNEAVEVVGSIASLSLPKAVILGNHDAWYSASEWGMKRCPYDRQKEDRVQQQLDLLGVSHVGYGKLDLPEFQLTVVGGRPFSWGGSDWKNTDFYQSRYDVSSFADSTRLIVAQAEAAAYETVIFLGHCGPLGLGDRPEDPCGKDWNPPGGDHGDPDFAAAITQTRQLGKIVPLVTFGHMHHQLRHSKQPRTAVVMSEGTLYLNAAAVPRIMPTATGCLRNFSLVELQADRVERASLVWVDETFAITSETRLYQAEPEIVAPAQAS